MATNIKRVNKPAATPTSGRVFGVSAKALPRIDSKGREKLENAARKLASPRRNYPEFTAK